MTRPLAATALAEAPLGLVGGDPRARLLDATITTVAERGYVATTVARIAAAAEVSVADFERCFESKEDCFLAAYDLAVGWLEDWVRASLAGRRWDWPAGVREAVAATLGLFAVDPRLARFCGGEMRFAGPRALERHRATVARLAVHLRAGREHCAWGEELPADLEQSLLTASIWWLGGAGCPAGAERLAETAPDLTYFLLVPYMDPAEARRLAGGG